eukprot:12407962-Karenia_brevis.AAC.1
MAGHYLTQAIRPTPVSFFDVFEFGTANYDEDVDIVGSSIAQDTGSSVIDNWEQLFDDGENVESVSNVVAVNGVPSVTPHRTCMETDRPRGRTHARNAHTHMRSRSWPVLRTPQETRMTIQGWDCRVKGTFISV